MKVLVVMDSFKGSITSKDACNAVKQGFMHCSEKFNVECIPMADGGEGTIDAFVSALDGKIVKCNTFGLFNESIVGYYGVVKDSTAIVETAVASGITLVSKEQLNPLKATTYGTGFIIKKVVEAGYKDIIVGLGGSGTNDGGMGVLCALGVEFYDEKGNALEGNGENLIKIKSINTKNICSGFKSANIILATDVKNVFYGNNGAAYVFAPQKGADEKTVKLLDDGLKNLSNVIKAQYKIDLETVEGSGAAGGLCGGLYAFSNSVIKSGANVLFEVTSLKNKISEADFVITGEGQTDEQTVYGKLPSEIGKISLEKTPVIVISGSNKLQTNKLYEQGVTAVFSITDGPMELESAMKNTKKLIEKTSFNIANLILKSKKQ